jgi:S1/P1 Nuclease
LFFQAAKSVLFHQLSATCDREDRMAALNVVGALIFAAGMLCSGHSRAWGPEGHAIVAEIAELRLTDSARDQVAQLLAVDDSHATHLDQIASWPDAVRLARPETGAWHFVDIPLDVSQYDASRDCAGGNCVVGAIQRFAGVLADRKADPKVRVEALKFLVHFVGDIHQPLHSEHDCSKFPPPECDRGGNLVVLTFFGRSTNFHSVWDGGMIEEALDVHLGPHFQPDLQATAAEAKKLNAKILEANAAAWAPDGLAAHLDTAPIQWANESHALAQTAYRLLPTPRHHGWDQTYLEEEWPVVETQLTRGAIRLAKIINEALQIKD